jgi:hypothetical protein
MATKRRLNGMLTKRSGDEFTERESVCFVSNLGVLLLISALEKAHKITHLVEMHRLENEGDQIYVVIPR